MEDMDIDDLLELIPILDRGVFEHPEAAIRTVLTHAEFQVVILALQRVVPHLQRQALEADASWNDVVYWMRSARSGKTVLAGPGGTYSSPGVTLRPLMPRDLDGFYLASLDPELNHRWRFRGRTPSLAEFQSEMMGEHVLAQYVVAHLDSEAPIGLVVAYGPDLVANHCRLAIQRSHHAPPGTRGLMVEGTFLFVQYLFDHFGLRKLYFEIPEYNRELLVDGLESLIEEEGRFRDYYFHGGRHWDLFTYSLYRSRWDEVTSGLEELSRTRDERNRQERV